MQPKLTKRYCATPAVLNTLERDGLGWGHDLLCGSFQADAPARTSFIRWLKRAFS